MRFIDWFSGIGGFRLGLERAGLGPCVAHSEIDDYAEKVYQKHWPGSRNLGDIREVATADIPDADLWCGGFPCQDISVAGNRAGLSGKRSGLYWELVRCLRVARPQYILLENVAGLLHRGMEGVISALAGSGYDTEWASLSAAQFGAAHIRRRVFILAYTTDNGRARGLPPRPPRVFGEVPERCTWWETEPDDPRKDDGVPGWMVRSAGASVVPQVVEWIGRRILEHGKEEVDDG